MSLRLEGKVVLITGAARGIGAAVAVEAAARGANVALTGLEPAELAARARELGDGHIWCEADVSDADSIRSAVRSTVEELGRIDVVVANAGIGTYGTVEKGDPDAWLRTIDINLNGVYRTVHATLPELLASRGYVSVIASIASFAPVVGMSSYNVTKAGVEIFVRALRQEVRFRGVDAGTVHPSWIDTDLVRESFTELETLELIRAKLPRPLKRTTSVEDCARAIVDGVAGRKARVFVPRSAALLYWLRSLITSAPGERLTGSGLGEIVPALERELEALGRSASLRTTAINQLPTSARKLTDHPQP